MISKTPYTKLTKRRQFVEIAKQGRYKAGPLCTVQWLPSAQTAYLVVAVGFTASKKVGNAVQRNFAKRRLRAIMRELVPLLFPHTLQPPSLQPKHPTGGCVIIAKREALNAPYDHLMRDVERQLRYLMGGATKEVMPSPKSKD